MNRENAKDYLPLVQALADGKVIQEYRHVDIGKQAWRDCVNPEFDRYPASNYRIKPEPREFFMVLDNDGTGSYLTYEEEIRAKRKAGRNMKYIRVREVLE